MTTPTAARRAGPATGTSGLWLRAAVVAYLAFLVALLLAEIVRRGLAGGASVWRAALLAPEARGALVLSAWTSALAAVVGALFGTATAWALVRYEFPGRRLLSALVDLPLAVPTLLTGLMLVALYGPQGWLGAQAQAHGVAVAFAPPGIVLALLFVTFPLAVRTVEPVVAELDPAEEEAALLLGASRATTFRRVVLPGLLPALTSGMAQTFARALAEFGSLVVVSGNVPRSTLTAPVFVAGAVESGQPEVAAATSTVLLAAAIGMSLAGRQLARWAGARHAP
jgi:sulfate transport system permease protein